MAHLNLTLSQEELLELLAGNREKAFKSLVEKILNQVLQAESMEQLGADPYERADSRTDYRNGSRERTLTTRIGSIILEVPRHRNHPFHTQLFESYQRHEVALLTTMAEMVVMGVSTRKVGRVMEEICGKEFNRSTVSEVCKRLDPEVEAFRNRKLTDAYPFIMVDATYFKVREDHKIVSKCIMIAIGYSSDGHKEVLSFGTYPEESNQTWLDFMSRLKSQGLESPVLITSDAHPSIRRAISRVYPMTAWQRCQFHFTRNILDQVPKAHQEGVRQMLRDVFDSKSREAAVKAKKKLVEEYYDVAEKAMDIFEEGFEDALTVMALPPIFQKVIRTSNPIERLNCELKRRSDVIKIFPNERSLQRLIGSVIIAEHEKYQSLIRKYSMKTYNSISPVVRLALQKKAVEQYKLLQAA